MCGPCADLREASQPVSSGAEHPIVQCPLLSGSPQTGGWEADGGSLRRGSPRMRPWRPRAPRSPCPALPCLAWVRCVGKCLLDPGRRGVLTGAQRHSNTEDRGVWRLGHRALCHRPQLEGWDRSGGFRVCSVPSLEHRAGLCVPLGRAWFSQRACPCVALFCSSDDPGGTHLCPCPAI